MTSNVSSCRVGEVILLDGRSVEVLIQPRLFAGDLFDLVASHFDLKEKEYFGLAFLDETGQYSWLNLERRVLEHEYAQKCPPIQIDAKNTTDMSKLRIVVPTVEPNKLYKSNKLTKIRNLKNKNKRPKASTSTSLLNLSSTFNSVENRIKKKLSNNGTIAKLFGSNKSSSTSDLVAPVAPLPQIPTGCHLQGESTTECDANEAQQEDPLYDVIADDIAPGEVLENTYQELPIVSPVASQAPWNGKPSLEKCEAVESVCDEEAYHSDTTHQPDTASCYEEYEDNRLVLYFLVKYFVESISMLQDATTIKLFYLQAKSLFINEIVQVDLNTSLQLSALILQVTYGDLVNNETKTRNRIHSLQLISSILLSELSTYQTCEDRIIKQYQELKGTTRGNAIHQFMSIIEKQPTYGVHFYEVKDKSSTPYWLGLSFKGIDQFDYNDRAVPVRQFSWKQLENLYFREKKFSIEVRDLKRVVHTLSSINLYENAIEDIDNYDDLSSAICDPTTQVSVSRRTFGPSNVTVYVWFAASSSLTKCIWSMAIAQHQFYIDRRLNKSKKLERSKEELVRSLDENYHRNLILFGTSRKRKNLNHPRYSFSASSIDNSSPYSSNTSLNFYPSGSSSGSSSLLSLNQAVSESDATSLLTNHSSGIHRSLYKMSSLKINRKQKMSRLRQLQTQLNAKYDELRKLDQLEHQILSKAQKIGYHSSMASPVSSHPYSLPHSPIGSMMNVANEALETSSTSSSDKSSSHAHIQPVSLGPSSVGSLKNFVVTGRSSALSTTDSLRRSSFSKRSSQASLPPESPLPGGIQHHRSKSVGVSSRYSLDRSKGRPDPQENNANPTTLPPTPPSNQTNVRTARPPSSSLFASPYVNKYDTSVQSLMAGSNAESSNLYSVPNRRTSVALNSLDDTFLLRPNVPLVSTTNRPKEHIPVATRRPAMEPLRESTQSLGASSQDSQSSLDRVMFSFVTSAVSSSTNSVTVSTVSYKFEKDFAPSRGTSCYSSHSSLAARINDPENIESSVDDVVDSESTAPESLYSHRNIEEDNLALYKSLLMRTNSFGKGQPRETKHAPVEQHIPIRREYESNYANIEPFQYRNNQIQSQACNNQTQLSQPALYQNAQSILNSAGDFNNYYQNMPSPMIRPPKTWYETDLDEASISKRAGKKTTSQSGSLVSNQSSVHPSAQLFSSKPIGGNGNQYYIGPYSNLHATSNQSEPESSVDEISDYMMPKYQSHYLQPSMYGTTRGSMVSPTPSQFSVASSSVSTYQYNKHPPMPVHAVTIASTIPSHHSFYTNVAPSVASSVTLTSGSSSISMTPCESTVSLQPMNQSIAPLSTVAFVPSIQSEPTNSIASGSSSGAGAVPVASCKGNIVEVDVVTVGHFQPGYEETKPYTLSDFYKYSQRYRNAQKTGSTQNNATNSSTNSENLPNQMNQLSLSEQNHSDFPMANRQLASITGTSGSGESDDNNNTMTTVYS